MKFGIVGIGHWGRKVLREAIALKEKGYLDDILVYDIQKDLVKKVPHRDIKVVNNLDDLIKQANLIHICTPNYTHYTIAKKALDAGKHVLIEKPMTTNSNQAYDLVERANKNGCILQVGHIFRFANVIKKVRTLWKNDFFGDVYYFNIRWSHIMPPNELTNVIWDLLPHPIDILNYITSDWPEYIIGTGRSYRIKGVFDVAFIQMSIADVIANIHISWVSPLRRRLLEIVGSEKSALVECVRQEINVFEVDSNNIKEYPLDITKNNTISEEILNFISSVKTGKNNPNSSIIGVRTVEKIETFLKNINHNL